MTLGSNWGWSDPLLQPWRPAPLLAHHAGVTISEILAGLVLGMSTHGLSAGEAGAMYVTLAVGDALVAVVGRALGASAFTASAGVDG